MVALAAAGPQAPAIQAFAGVRANVCHTWFRGDRAGRPQILRTRTTAPRAIAPVALTAQRPPFLPQAPHSHSLFQRPPPLSL
jgi:hypothetical protein